MYIGFRVYQYACQTWFRYEHSGQHHLKYFGTKCVLGAFFGKALPIGLEKALPKIIKLSSMFGSYELYNGLNHFQMQTRGGTTTYVFKYATGIF